MDGRSENALVIYRRKSCEILPGEALQTFDKSSHNRSIPGFS